MRVYLSNGPLIHDLEAISQTHTHTQVVQGSVEDVVVTVKNNGNIDETFDVRLYADLSPPYGNEITIGTKTVTGLAIGASTTVTFSWNTTGVPGGIYAITALADPANVIAETNETNNWCNAPSTLRIMLRPVADINGPYTGNEGSPINFNAGASHDDDGTIVLYEWDWNGDGTYDESSLVPTKTHQWCDDYTGTVGLRVTDNDTLTSTDNTTVTVYNVPPTVEAGPDQQVAVNHATSFSGSFTDPGCDTWTITWDFGDGESASGTLMPTHTYTKTGVYIVNLTVIDDDGGVGFDTLNVTVIQPVGGLIGTVDKSALLNSSAVQPLYYWLLAMVVAAAAVMISIKRLK
jgi:hypothetical protein